MPSKVNQALNLKLNKKVGDLEVYSYSDPFSTTNYGGQFIMQNGNFYGGKAQSYNGTQTDKILNDYISAGQVQKTNRPDGSSYYFFNTPDRKGEVTAASEAEAIAKRDQMFKNYSQDAANYSKTRGQVTPDMQGSVGLDFFSKYFNLSNEELLTGQATGSRLLPGETPGTIQPAGQPGSMPGALPGVLPSTALPSSTPSPQPGASSGSQITRDTKGSYVFGGKTYETLAHAQAAAKRSGVDAVYTPAPITSPTVPTNPVPGMPTRDMYAPGVAGDKQFQARLDRWNTQNNPLPKNLDEATSADQFDALLNNLQSSTFDGLNSEDDVTLRSNNASGLQGPESFFQKFLSGGGDASSGGGNVPEFNAESKLNQLRQQYGVDPLEGQVADIDKQIADVKAAQRSLQYDEEGKPVRMNVISGRVSEEERQANERLDALNREKGYIVDQLNNKYAVVNSLMGAAQTDYKNAIDSYEMKFNQTIQATNMLMNMDQSQKSMGEKARDDARANVTIITNALSNGSLQWENLDPKSKAQYSKLELQAGLPTGTIQAFSQKPGSAWEMSTVLPGVDQDGNAIATVLQKNKQTGEFKTTKLITDYAPNQGKNSEVLQQGTFVDDSGNEVAWTRYKDGSVQKQTIGAARKTADQMSPVEKEQNDFNKFFTDVVTKMQAQDSFGEPKLTRDGAAKIIKAKYPSITQASLNSLLNSIE